MKDGSKVLVELGRIAYFLSTNRAAEALRACHRTGQEQLARETELEECTARRTQLADHLCSGGRAGGLQRSLSYDHGLAGLAKHRSARLDQAAEMQAQAQRQLEERLAEAQRELLRLRLAEDFLRQQKRAGRRRRERKQEEELR